MTASLYDALLLLAVLFLATALALPLNGGEAFSSDQFFFPVYLTCVSFLYFGWFWTHGGQTLGMRSWKMRIVDRQFRPVNWKQAALRFVAAIFSWLFLGMGFFWILLDKNGLAWHDRLSGTMPVFDR